MADAVKDSWWIDPQMQTNRAAFMAQVAERSPNMPTPAGRGMTGIAFEPRLTQRQRREDLLTMWLFLYHSPVARMTVVGFLTAVALDIDKYIAFKNEHPGASYDWAVAFAQALKGTISAFLVALGVANI